MFAHVLSKRVQRVLACAAAVIWISSLGVASAQNFWSQKTSVTFSQPVEIPGRGAQVLPAGTYVFKLLDSISNRHIVQVFSEDETRLYSTILAIPNYRRVATDRTVMTFEERPAGQPAAVQAWFYPGNNWGHEFVYPRSRAVELAQAADEPVLSITDTAAAAAAELEPEPAPTAPPLVALAQAPVTAVGPTGAEVELAEVVEPPPVQAAALPRTASSLPLLGLIGLLSIGLGLSLRRAATRLG